MRKELADITVVLDRSGSMNMIKEDAEGGLAAFIETQKHEDGEANFSLIQFDDTYEAVYKAAPITEVDAVQLVPRGSTALLDAVGRAITETKQRLNSTPEKDKPGIVIFVIITDGKENASREYNKSTIKNMIENAQNEGWQFTFLGANQDAFAEAGSLGIARSAIMEYDTTAAGVQSSFTAACSNVTRMRSSVADGVPVFNAYTDEERASSKIQK